MQDADNIDTKIFELKLIQTKVKKKNPKKYFIEMLMLLFVENNIEQTSKARFTLFFIFSPKII